MKSQYLNYSAILTLIEMLSDDRKRAFLPSDSFVLKTISLKRTVRKRHVLKHII